jgi:hypothetical protein
MAQAMGSVREDITSPGGAKETARDDPDASFGAIYSLRNVIQSQMYFGSYST